MLDTIHPTICQLQLAENPKENTKKINPIKNVVLVVENLR
jgi:hypothetical protein